MGPPGGCAIDRAPHAYRHRGSRRAWDVAHGVRRQLYCPGLRHSARNAKKELALADQLIESLAAPWDPTDYKDTYTDVLKDVIKQKAEGKPIKAPARANRPAKIVDLAKALRDSLKARGGASNARKGKRAGRRAA